MSIDVALSHRLAAVLGHERVYPDARWLTLDDTGSPVLLADLPVLVYRQLGGGGEQYLDVGRSSYREDQFALEVFAESRADCGTVRDVLMAVFRGPVDPLNPGRWQTWGPPGKSVRAHWALVDDADSDFEAIDSEVYEMFRYSRMRMTVQWQE